MRRSIRHLRSPQGDPVPRFLEDKLKREAARKGFTGKRADRYTFGGLNNMGAMRGNRTTAKGRAMSRKHARDMRRGKRRA